MSKILKVGPLKEESKQKEKKHFSDDLKNNDWYYLRSTKGVNQRSRK
jgi:hypothetical protein